jgi:hypothetical protein
MISVLTKRQINVSRSKIHDRSTKFWATLQYYYVSEKQNVKN